MTSFLKYIIAASLLGLGNCAPSTPRPDYTIQVVPASKDRASVAVPPNCLRWSDNDLNFLDSQPLPQFGCADARNLAMMVERPEDLLQGREPGPTRGVIASGAIQRYDHNQTRGLIGLSQTPDTSVDITTAPTATSNLSGESPPSSGSSAAPGK